MTIRLITTLTFLLVSLASPSLFAYGHNPKIQVAILLDTSSSMDGLIEQAKARLWTIVNQLADTRRDGHKPLIEVALYEYGKSSLPAYAGFMRRITPLTTDLDRVSEELFALSTNGGSEYCGMVINRAVRELNWSRDTGDLKVIFIAGNEPFTQGNIPYQESIGVAAESGIVVNTIFCGDHYEGIRTSWKDGADRSGGDYFSINQNRTVSHIITPYDERLASLNRELNATYIPYGKEGRVRKDRQQDQDKKAEELSPAVLADRSVMKSKSAYSNKTWDMTDAFRDNTVDPGNIADDMLPAEMKKMTPEQRRAHVKSALEKRTRIQAEIQNLSEKRNAHIRSVEKNSAEDSTFGKAVSESLKKQAAKKNFSVQ